MSKLDGKVAVVTRATSGMRFASARLLASQGAHVYIIGPRKDRLDRGVHAINTDAPGAVTGIQADSGSPGDLARLFGAVQSAHGRVDVVYAGAGIGTLAEPPEAPKSRIIQASLVLPMDSVDLVPGHSIARDRSLRRQAVSRSLTAVPLRSPFG